MSVKQDVLKLLEENKGEFLSGEKTAELLDVSRTAVWKAIRTLQSEGHNIEAVTNKGYMLKTDSNLLSAEGIRLHLDRDVPLHLFPTIDSTNRYASSLALEGAQKGTCVISEHQSKGRGRLGRSFYSPEKKGIYLSMILKPDFDMSKAILITVAAACAVLRAIRKVCGIEAEVKWVNDIYIDGKKVCGILTEAITDFETGTIKSIVTGIGINCVDTELPDDIRDIAGAIPGDFSRNMLAAEVINQLLSISEHLEERDYIDEYRKASLITWKEINVIKTGREPVEAFACDIDDNGGLVVMYENGERETLTTGEVSIRLRG